VPSKQNQLYRVQYDFEIIELVDKGDAALLERLMNLRIACSSGEEHDATLEVGGLRQHRNRKSLIERSSSTSRTVGMRSLDRRAVAGERSAQGSRAQNCGTNPFSVQLGRVQRLSLHDKIDPGDSVRVDSPPR
jgi:hypothetical protein